MGPVPCALDGGCRCADPMRWVPVPGAPLVTVMDTPPRPVKCQESNFSDRPYLRRGIQTQGQTQRDTAPPGQIAQPAEQRREVCFCQMHTEAVLWSASLLRPGPHRGNRIARPLEGQNCIPANKTREFGLANRQACKRVRRARTEHGCPPGCGDTASARFTAASSPRAGDVGPFCPQH